jgi:hypothetical protein
VVGGGVEGLVCAQGGKGGGIRVHPITRSSIPLHHEAINKIQDITENERGACVVYLKYFAISLLVYFADHLMDDPRLSYMFVWTSIAVLLNPGIDIKMGSVES